MMSQTRYESPFELADRVARDVAPSGRATRTLAIVMVSSLLGLLAILPLPWQQSAAGEGRVVAYAPTERQQNIEAPIEGRVIEWRVREGAHVKRGELIVRISDNDPEIMDRMQRERNAIEERLQAIRTRITAIDTRIELMQSAREAAVTGAQARVRMAQDRVRASEQAAQAAAATLRTAELNLERQRSLSESGLASTRTRELSELDYTKARTEQERAAAALSAARSEAEAIIADATRVQGDTGASIDDARANRMSAVADAASMEAELARMDVRLSRQATMDVTAPSDGTIVRLSGGQGREMVKAGDPLAIFIPDTESRAVELWVDGVDVPLLSVGRKVRLQFEGWPAVQFVGWPSVAVGSFGGKVALIDATDNGYGKFRIIITPDEQDDSWPSGRYLRQGVRAHGWVLLNRVSIGYELWRRFNGFPPVVSPEEPKHPAGSASK